MKERNLSRCGGGSNGVGGHLVDDLGACYSSVVAWRPSGIARPSVMSKAQKKIALIILIARPQHWTVL